MVLGVPEGESANLSDIFEMFEEDMGQGDEVTIHWLACSTLQLKQVGGRDHGLNAGDFGHRSDKPGRYRIKKAGNKYAWK